jgi:hypothetical protein
MLLLFAGSQTPRETAQRVAAVLFCVLLGALAFGWWRARERAVRDEADALIEREFLELEQEERSLPEVSVLEHTVPERTSALPVVTAGLVPSFPAVERKSR